MDKKNHIHSFRRSKRRKNIYRCTHPECTSYFDKEALEGKRCLCLLCEQEMIITPYHLKLADIVCDKCRAQLKRKRELGELQMEIDELFSVGKGE